MKIKLQNQNIIPLHQVPSSFYDPSTDGVTFSLLRTFKSCREKARLTLNGWSPKHNSFGTTFGSLTHSVLQRIYTDVRTGQLRKLPSDKYITDQCRVIESEWKVENPLADADSLEYLESSMILLEALMPSYFKYWFKDFTLIWKGVETEFKIPFEITHPVPGRKPLKTFLRGKLDGSFSQRLTAPQTLFETKTKAYFGEDSEATLADILPHELQVNVYLTYLQWVTKEFPTGVVYNIIRRPSFRRRKSEGLRQFAKRVAADVQRRPEYYFIRLKMSVEPKDLIRQQLEIRDLVADFLMWWNGHTGHYKNSDACEDRYGKCPFLPVCSRGDYSGLFKRDRVFRELADEV